MSLFLTLQGPFLSIGAIKDANEAVRAVKQPKTRGVYSKISPENQAAVAKYAIEHGNKAAVRHFGRKLDVDLKASSVATWKSKYLSEMQRKINAGDDDKEVTSLPVKKRGRPLLLGEDLDEKVKRYVVAIRNNGGIVTTAITLAAASAIVRRTDRNLLAENGGHITLTRNWAKSLLYRLHFVKRRGSTAAKISVRNFEEIKQQFLIDLKTVIVMEDIPPDLVFNWDHTGVSIVPGSLWTMEERGSKRVPIIGISDKRQVTAIFCGTLAGTFLPFQVIYQGKTSASLPSYKFPDDWHVTFTPNHWSNEQTMKEYIEKIILPYVQSKRRELCLSDDHPALAIYDVFKGQLTDDISSLLTKNNIFYVYVPANCTDRLQPMDISINKAAKEFMRNKFSLWYADEVEKRLGHSEETVPIDLKMSTMKPLGAQWLVSLFDYISSNRSLILNGFKDIAKYVNA